MYLIQVVSESREAWAIRQARLQAPDGEVLQVDTLRFRERADQIAVNVIVARVPAGKKVPKLKLDLAGEDGRVAQTEVGDLP